MLYTMGVHTPSKGYTGEEVYHQGYPVVPPIALGVQMGSLFGVLRGVLTGLQ